MSNLSALIARLKNAPRKSISGAIVFLVAGFFAITAKNVFIAGLSLHDSILSMLPMLAIKGVIGYFYRPARDRLLDQLSSGQAKRVMKLVSYALVQTTSFTIVIVMLIPADHLPRAIMGTFVTSLVIAKPVEWTIDRLTKRLGG